MKMHHCFVASFLSCSTLMLANTSLQQRIQVAAYEKATREDLTLLNQLLNNEKAKPSIRMFFAKNHPEYMADLEAFMNLPYDQRELFLVNPREAPTPALFAAASAVVVVAVEVLAAAITVPLMDKSNGKIELQQNGQHGLDYSL